MFYETEKNDHGLPHNPFKAIVAPRPIGWISTLDKDGKANLAPYSFFNAVCDTPPIVMFSSTGYKDSVSNIDATGEFVCNMANLGLKDEMNQTSASVAHEISEFDLAGLEMAASRLVKAPRVAKAVTALECKHLQTLRLKTLTGEFVCNMANLGLKDEMNQTSASVAHEISEFDLAGLEMAASRLVKAPRVAKAVTALECKHLQTLRLKTLTGDDTDSYVVFGQVVGVHIDESVIVDGKVDVTLYKPLSRLGYMDYAVVNEVFQMGRPKV